MRMLAVTPDSEILSLVAGMKLSRLWVIRMCAGTDGGIDECVVPLVQSLVGESIQHVQLSNFHSLSYTSPIGILEKSRRLEGLHFHECTAIETGTSDIPPSHTSAKAQITHRSLAYSGSIAKWLIRPEFPLDFANLFYADTTGSANLMVAALLEPVRETLKSLTFLADDLTAMTWPATIDILGDFHPTPPTQFPAVTHLLIVLSIPIDLPATSAIFSEIAKENTIQEIWF